MLKNKGKTMQLDCLRILRFINQNQKDIDYKNNQNNEDEVCLEKGKKSVLVTKRRKVVSSNPNLCQPERYCLNCNLCPGKSCAISQIDQSKLDRLFISYIYSKMEHIRNVRCGYER